MAVMLRGVTAAVQFPLMRKSLTSASAKMSASLSPNLSSSKLTSAAPRKDDRKLPVLLFDIMDTIVRDPFYHDVPAFFGWSLQRNFFKDGRSFDLEGLKKCMVNGYSYIDGVEDLLYTLKQKNYEMHAFTNYPIWYNLIEEKLSISAYMSWTFCSCIIGKRKPDPEFYLEALRHLKVDPANCVFIDDRLGNVEAAIGVGITGLQFKNADLLREDLSRIGIDSSTDDSHSHSHRDYNENS